jgi:hypothetical protein
MVQAFSQVYTKTRKLLLRMGSMPKKAEKVDFLSKLPGIGSDLSISHLEYTDLDNLVSVSVDDEVGFDVGGFGVRLD